MERQSSNEPTQELMPRALKLVHLENLPDWRHLALEKVVCSNLCALFKETHDMTINYLVTMNMHDALTPVKTCKFMMTQI